MLKEQNLEPLWKHRRKKRLKYFYNIVEGNVPAIGPSDFLIPSRDHRVRKAKREADFIYDKNADRRVINNDRGFKVQTYKTDLLNNSFFVRTAVDWNQLDTKTVHARSADAFINALEHGSTPAPGGNML